jgi:hypothetical protein
MQNLKSQVARKSLGQFYEWKCRTLETQGESFTKYLNQLEEDRDCIDNFLNDISSKTTDVEIVIDGLSIDIANANKKYYYDVMLDEICLRRS